jgi:cytokinin riboside 5'-monophosphate phosphoribohydrolase
MQKIRSACVFCASSQEASQSLKDLATDLGQKIAAEGISLVYGGASIGLMGSIARGAHKSGGKVIAIFPEIFVGKDIDFAEADEFIVTDDLRERKTLMEEKSDAFIALPGGIGTLDEIAEILTLIQLKQISKPLVLINFRNFYDPLINFFESVVQQKLAKEKFLKSYFLAKNNEEAIDFLKSYP